MTSRGESTEDMSERLGRMEASLSRLVRDFDVFRASVSEELQNTRTHAHYHSMDWNAFHRSFKSFVYDVEDRQRDLVELLVHQSGMSNPQLKVVTDHPVAADTVDHLHPRGVARDNTRQPRFVAASEALFRRPLRHLDIGCAGGGLVWDFTQRGHRSIGIEGSDLCRRMQRAEWRTIPERLFTADVRYPFRIEDDAGSPQRFDLVTAWEVFEHIPEWAVPALLENVKRHLADDGLLVASVATFEDSDEAGRQYHATVQAKDWWVEALRAADLEEVESPFAVGDYPRGSGNPRADDWNAAVDPSLGFHLVARHAAGALGGGHSQFTLAHADEIPHLPIVTSAAANTVSRPDGLILERTEDAFFTTPWSTNPLLSESSQSPREHAMVSDKEGLELELIEEASRFDSVPLKETAIVTSIPKSATVLLRNICYYIFYDNMKNTEFAFYDSIHSRTKTGKPELIVGHLPYSVECCGFLRDVAKKILLIRDPVDLLIAQARAAFDPRNDRADFVFARQNHSFNEFMNFLVTGYSIEGITVGSFGRQLSEFSVGWSTESVMIVDHDELVSPSTDVVLRILHYLEVEVPEDVEVRVAAAKNPARSQTFIQPMSELDREKARQTAVDLLAFYVPGAFDWYRSARRKCGSV